MCPVLTAFVLGKLVCSSVALLPRETRAWAVSQRKQPKAGKLRIEVTSSDPAPGLAVSSRTGEQLIKLYRDQCVAGTCTVSVELEPEADDFPLRLSLSNESGKQESRGEIRLTLDPPRPGRIIVRRVPGMF